MTTPPPELAVLNGKLIAGRTAGVRYNGSSHRRIRTGTQTLLVLIVAYGLGGCSSSKPTISQLPDGTTITWTSVDTLNQRLPPTIQVFHLSDGSVPLRAWYVDVDLSAPQLSAAAVMAADTTDNRESVRDLARNSGACAAVNSGYFTMNETPAHHVGLLVVADTLHTEASHFELGTGNELGRAAIGFHETSAPTITWARTVDGSVEQIEYAEGSITKSRPWRPMSAIGAGPMLLQNGRPSISSDAEGFSATSIPATHPRTAAGVTADGRLILMVVDGRQDVSRGVNLPELASLLQSAGAIEGLNLDGGGSSTLVVGDVLVNRPAGGTFQREVMSGIVVNCMD